MWVSTSSRNTAIQSALARRADSKQSAMDEALFTWARLADHVGRTMVVEPNTTIESFRFFVGSSSPELEVPALISVSWATPVANNPVAIAKYEEYARKYTGCATATINYNLGGNFSWRPPPAEQPEFLPFTQTTYGGSAEAACASASIGFDLMAIDETNVARRTSVQAAIDGRQLLAARPVDTTVSAIARLGIIQSVLAPVFVDGEFVGLASAAFQSNNLATTGAVDYDESIVYTTLTDVESGLVLSSDAGNTSHPTIWVETRNLTFGGRTWQLELQADAAFAAQVPNEAVWTSLLACALAVVVAALVVARVGEEASVSKATKRLLLQVSHDLRTPLHSMWHAAKEIAELPAVQACAEAEEPIETLKWCATLAKNILDNILDMSHINMGTLSVTNEPDDVLAFMSAAVHIMRATAEDGGTELRFVGEETGPVCMVDREKVLRAVLNIIGNAIKFAPGGLVQVQVSLERDEEGEGEADEGHHNHHRPTAASQSNTTTTRSSSSLSSSSSPPRYILRAAVQDNGRGMNAITLATATRAYVHTSRSGGGGSGIGLHVAKTIVEQYGGEIALASRGPGLGSTVSFFMVMSKATNEQVVASSASEASVAASPLDDVRAVGAVADGACSGPASTTAAPAASPTSSSVVDDEVVSAGDDSDTVSGGGGSECVVLVVDDSRMNRRVAKHAVRLLQHVTVEECVNGEEALDRLKELAQRNPDGTYCA